MSGITRGTLTLNEDATVGNGVAPRGSSYKFDIQGVSGMDVSVVRLVLEDVLVFVGTGGDDVCRPHLQKTRGILNLYKSGVLLLLFYL